MAEYEANNANQMPSHEVTIPSPFYMGKYEVTQEQYEALGPPVVPGMNLPALSGGKTPSAVRVMGVVELFGREGAHFARREGA